MDPILEVIYSTVLSSAPYLIAAYALMWAVMLIYIIYSNRSLSNTEKQLSALEEAITQLESKA
ncbi:MAG: hypothetical protein FWE41_08120 [Coriobacteriia bacterium]|nr:hypothetical protein [Coriobacteriia bacterium]MCL2750359.1 hypothetical protein [Coriobacteriia bacterium]